MTFFLVLLNIMGGQPTFWQGWVLHLALNFEWFFLTTCRDRQYFNLRFQFWNSMSVFRVWMADCEAKAGMLSTISSQQCFSQQKKCKQNHKATSASPNKKMQTKSRQNHCKSTYPDLIKVIPLLQFYIPKSIASPWDSKFICSSMHVSLTPWYCEWLYNGKICSSALCPEHWIIHFVSSLSKIWFPRKFRRCLLMPACQT